MTGEFIRRFLMHVLPKGSTDPALRPARHWRATRAEKLARARELIAACQLTRKLTAAATPTHHRTCSEEFDYLCPHCGSRMAIIETFEPGHCSRHRPSAPVVIIPNTS